MFYRAYKRSRGFTLIELVVVIVVIGVLAVLALPRFIDLTEDSKKAVTASTIGSFRSAVSLTKSQWLVKNKPATINVEGNTVGMSNQGFPVIPNGNSAGCITLWENLLASSMDIIVYPGAVSVADWSALGFGSICIYINHGGDTFVSTQTPFFAYFSNSGLVTGFNIN